ncbi:signal peptide peptidase SppA [Trebonia kvetii]|uniref:Signal peptide peptidase SppA n=1 Tax=Trebonia kvetii TaxID=2480626 RepID=A0A6P2BYV9_9ACTN|nr:signal peptide peptidase SppA [Trebonia kvetii]TVZ04110.1 signal peptide peptidase SppA [Trebonia kvetii]
MAEAKLAGQIARMRQRRTGPLILELDLTDGIAEGQPADPLAALLTMRRTRLQDVLDGLRRAAADHKVRALVVKVGGSRIGLAKIQELRAAIGDFRKSGKLAVAWSESFGDFLHGNLPYYLATGFDRIYLQPSGSLGLTGVAVEQVFLRNALDKLGIDFQSAKRHEFKSAADPLTEAGFTGPARKAAARLAESVTEQLAGAIAAGRGLSVEQAAALIANGPYLALQALDAGLVDGLMYRDEVYDQVRRDAGHDAMLLYLQRYQRTQSLGDLPRRLGSSVQSIGPGQHERCVAMIYAHGAIRQGRSGRGGPGGSGMGSDTVAAALRAAAADENVRAVVLRVNSPGGSAVASDVIWREVVRLRAAGKPVVVSMGDVAASGGYFISAPADVIVAQPGTITGSIGVIMGKPVLQDLFERAGVTTDSITDGAGAAQATMFSSARPFSEAEWARINAWLDAIYADFTAKVASGRRMPLDRVHELARGRVWTGADAIAAGLADEAGGMREATAIARKRAGLPDDAPVRVYPRLGPLDQLRPAESSEARPAARSAVGAGSLAALFADGWGPAWRFAAAAGLPPYGPLTLPGVWTIS